MQLLKIPELETYAFPQSFHVILSCLSHGPSAVRPRGPRADREPLSTIVTDAITTFMCRAKHDVMKRPLSTQKLVPWTHKAQAFKHRTRVVRTSAGALRQIESLPFDI
ncbi:hypothetical protein EVAR_6584_1 [Eumeta japonica]|uniref:Uncharacterized protein n=1 Tax=Eumeta variegata TaxID=151549 RepID=A0A4C1SQZ3_EUMVA|nr:hypothetical protein EVAR_6584_1 [Eumeta japonica]